MNNNNWIRDFERKQFEEQMANESRRQNDLLALQIANQERQRKKEEEKSYKDKIDCLRLALAQASDSHQQEQIQILLDEAQADYEGYLERKRKSERIGRVISIVLLLIMIPLLFLMFKEIFGGQNNRQKSGTSTVQTVLKAGEEDGTFGASAQSAVLSSSDDRSALSMSEPVPSSSSSALPAPYANTEHTNLTEFTVDVTVTDLNIRQSPSLSAPVVRLIPKGRYTITATRKVDGQLWGKLKSGEGWIALNIVGGSVVAHGENVSGVAGQANQRIDTKNLTTEQVKKWVATVFMRTKGNSKKYVRTDLVIAVQMAEDGLVYANITIPSDPNFNAEKVGQYRINGDGHLEHAQFDHKLIWEPVSEEYTE
ncbi:SH3 domain-containing protein [Streptococcus ruminantium]|uniref:SH3 domain-containing protein n=2 Tax=Streptococcus ruminantium TaxID=1917441 RepID=UPI0012DFCE1B|nr:SH3 domain-containing protein [Streptococcus ruminantium]